MGQSWVMRESGAEWGRVGQSGGRVAGEGECGEGADQEKTTQQTKREEDKRTRGKGKKGGLLYCGLYISKPHSMIAQESLQDMHGASPYQSWRGHSTQLCSLGGSSPRKKFDIIVAPRDECRRLEQGCCNLDISFFPLSFDIRSPWQLALQRTW